MWNIKIKYFKESKRKTSLIGKLNPKVSFSTLIQNNSESYNNIKEILFGSILGDGKLEIAPRAINARFGFIQSAQNKKYFLFLLDQLSPLVSVKYREYSYLDKRTGKIYKTWHFTTLSLPFFTYYYELFYNKSGFNNKKVIPDNILELLTPVSLSYWILCDGYKKKIKE